MVAGVQGVEELTTPGGSFSDDSQWVSLDQRHKAPFVERVGPYEQF